MDTNQAQQEKLIRMTQTPVAPLICRMAVPTMISMLITAIYNMADTFFVGRIGTSATAAVGIIFSVMAVIQAIGFFFGQGSGNYISRKLGAGDVAEATKMAATGFFTAMLAGLSVTVLGIIFLEPFCRFLGATDTILPYAMDYLHVILLGAPYMTAALVLNNQLRLQGNAFYAMIGLVSGGVLNIFLDPLFIFGFDMGITGAALATILSQAVSFCLLLLGCNKMSDNLAIRFRNFSPSLARYEAIVGGGLPSLCRQGLASVATICLNTAAGPFGDAAIAAMSIVTRLSQFAASAVLGFGQGFQPVCGFNYGAKRYDRVREGFWFCILVGSAVLLVLSVLGFIFAPQLIALFRAEDAQVIAIGALALRIQCITFPLLGWVTICNMLLQNLARVVQASLLSIARQGLFFLPLILIFPHIFGILGVQICQPAADVLTFGISLPLTIPTLRFLKTEMHR
ncbi:MAG: MATE family efflux transporter [Eubacterium sp.]|nr:MATE family efflux transporter [Eubacterium sp.]